VYVNGTLWDKEKTSLIERQGENAYLETTTPDGQVLLLLGNGLYGNIPLSGSTLSIVYSTTVGISGNSSILNDDFSLIDSFVINSDPAQSLDLTAVAYTSSSGGDNEESPDQVKFTSPRLFASNDRAVRRQDYNAYVLQSGGLISANCWGEYEEALETGTADNSMMNRAYISALKSTLTTSSKVIATANGTDTTYNGSLDASSVPAVPGSVVVIADNEVFRDYDGLGILTSSEVVFTSFTGGTGYATDSEGSYLPSNAFDGTDTSLWRSVSDPNSGAVVRLGYKVAASTTLGSIRLQAPVGRTQQVRSFPKKISVWGSNAPVPNYTDDADWTLIRGGVYLPEPGANGFTEWVPLNNSISYTSFSIKIESHYGTESYVQVAELQAQPSSSSSTVDYSTGAISLTFSSPPVNLTPITATTLATDLSSSEQSSLFSYIEKYTHFTTQLSYSSPVAQQYNLIIDIYVNVTYSTITTYSSAQSAIENLFEYKNNSIGKLITISDIYSAINNIEGVDYCVVQSPEFDPYPYRFKFPYLQSVSLNMYYTTRS
jgi:hypothetical protein